MTKIQQKIKELQCEVIDAIVKELTLRGGKIRFVPALQIGDTQYTNIFRTQAGADLFGTSGKADLWEFDLLELDTIAQRMNVSTDDIDKKVYVVTTSFSPLDSDETDYSVEKVFDNRKAAEAYASKLKWEQRIGEYAIVPEDVFNSWPLDDICNSPIPEYEGYTYKSYVAQTRRSNDYRTGVLTCKVCERTVTTSICQANNQ